ncbi:MAG: hypothetical protein IPJ86_17785 [Bacteroidetes bacterium]|jgi:hypothetical protein|nr:hypothetical protein [Bacteroidota bacterium]
MNILYIYGYQNNNMLQKVILFFVINLFFNLSARGQSGGGHYIDRVVEIQSFSNAKHVTFLTQLLQDYSGNSAIVLTCEEQGWVVFKIDLDEISGDDQLSAILKSAGLQFLIKEGAVKKDVVNACKGELHKF